MANVEGMYLTRDPPMFGSKKFDVSGFPSMIPELGRVEVLGM